MFSNLFHSSTLYGINFFAPRDIDVINKFNSQCNSMVVIISAANQMTCICRRKVVGRVVNTFLSANFSNTIKKKESKSAREKWKIYDPNRVKTYMDIREIGSV